MNGRSSQTPTSTYRCIGRVTGVVSDRLKLQQLVCEQIIEEIYMYIINRQSDEGSSIVFCGGGLNRFN